VKERHLTKDNAVVSLEQWKALVLAEAEQFTQTRDGRRVKCLFNAIKCVLAVGQGLLLFLFWFKFCAGVLVAGACTGVSSDEDTLIDIDVYQ
jgi:hypothetical protein